MAWDHSPLPRQWQQGIDARRAELEKIKIARAQLDAQETAAQAALANDHGEPTRSWQLRSENLGAAAPWPQAARHLVPMLQPLFYTSKCS